SQVKVFGAWLDADVAGRKAARGDSEEEAAVLYKKSVVCMQARTLFLSCFSSQLFSSDNCDAYAEAVSLMEASVGLVGGASRLGGEYGLWLAEAYQATGDDARACALLRRLIADHTDRDVRKAS
ncbi:unnamed protein product, partial [Phaeothamnion confervicola]